MQQTPKQFAMVCFLVLMENDKGVVDKAPSYIEEKKYMLEMGLDAFGALDIYNMRKVVEWHEAWGIELPAKVEEHYRLEEQAFKELQDKGFDL